MKPIYIYRPNKKSYKLIMVLGFALLILFTLSFFGPTIIKNYINKKGESGQGFAFRVGDVSFNPFITKLGLEDLKVFDKKSSVVFAEISNVTMDFDWTNIFSREKNIKAQIDVFNFTFSKDLSQGIAQVKEKDPSNFYISKFETTIKKLNIRNLKNDDTQTILSLKDTQAKISDVGTGSKKTTFNIHSQVSEGGELILNGKTHLESKDKPWIIDGEMTGITPGVIEKLAGDKLPFEIAETKIDAKISAESSAGQVEGIIEPDVQKFKLRETKEQGIIKRNFAKVANFLLDKPTKGDKEIKIEMPFVLNQNFSFDLQKTLEKLKE